MPSLVGHEFEVVHADRDLLLADAEESADIDDHRIGFLVGRQYDITDLADLGVIGAIDSRALQVIAAISPTGISVKVDLSIAAVCVWSGAEHQGQPEPQPSCRREPWCRGCSRPVRLLPAHWTPSLPAPDHRPCG